jgi:arylsulfatase A-like enzyme
VTGKCFCRITTLAVILVLYPAFGVAKGQPGERPNFIWLVSEDNSKHYLRLYNENGAAMPAVESLAEQGLVFENAFSNAPVCSVARSTLATGAYGPRVATQYHRAFKLAKLPENLEPVSKILMDDGYYTSNRHKEDYNFRKRGEVWHASGPQASWKNREPGQPFFHMESWGTTHESKLHFPSSNITAEPALIDKEQDVLPPIYPDTVTFRYTHAFYLEQHQTLDEQLAKVIDELEQSGELENTFIFYFGDHGGVLPYSKGYLYETGLNVPLVVRVPNNFRDRVGAGLNEPGPTRVEGFVSFVDFAPTLLELAGVDIPAGYDGLPFLSTEITLSELNKRNTTLSFADRFDEKMDLVRSLRIGRYKYIRYYQPFYPDAMYNDYRYKQAAYRELKDLHAAGELHAAGARFFEARPPEVLYDVVADPFETRNLAQLGEYARIVHKMRVELNERLKQLPDLSFLPETVIVSEAIDDPVRYGREKRDEIARLIDIADLQLSSFKDASSRLERLLDSTNPWERYWALMVLSRFGPEAADLVDDVQHRIDQEQAPLIRARAYEFLSLAAAKDVRQEMQDLIDQSSDTMELLEILNIATHMHETVGYTFDLPDTDEMTDVRDVKYWFDSRKAYLSE